MRRRVALSIGDWRTKFVWAIGFGLVCRGAALLGAPPVEKPAESLTQSQRDAFTWFDGLGLAMSADEVIKPRLAATPPMGWNSWEAFRKELDENAIKAQVDAIVKLGLRDAGYI